MPSEAVRPYEGEWRFIDPPAILGDPTRDPSVSQFVLKSALAVSEAAGRYFAEETTRRVVTLLSVTLSLPRPEYLDDALAHGVALRKALGSIGFQIMSHGGDISSVGRRRSRLVIPGELENPTLAFERAIGLHGTGARIQVSNPQGVGYATAWQDSQPNAFTLGWCDPVGGTRCETLVDVARIRQEFPNLRPEIKLPLPGHPDC